MKKSDENRTDGEMDELAGIKPKQSEKNPIPRRAAYRREENRRRAIEEKEKDYYANQKPKNSGNHERTFHSKEKSMPVRKKTMPDGDMLLSDRFPEIITDAIYLQTGEKCYFSSYAQLIDRKVVKNYVGHSFGISAPGLFKGQRFGSGLSWKKEIGEHEEQHIYDGMLYVTNKRTIFVEQTKGFDKRHTSISAIKPFSDGIEIQYGSKTYMLGVNDAGRLYELYGLMH